MLVGANAVTRKALKEHLISLELQISEFGEVSMYVGISIVQDRTEEAILIHQTPYIDKVLSLYKMENCNAVGTLMAEAD